MLNRFKSVLMSAVGASELGLQYPNDSDNDVMTDYINSNYVMEVENKPYSRPSFLGLTAEETQVCLNSDYISFTELIYNIFSNGDINYNYNPTKKY